jgi:hypothetical protein
MEAIESFFDLLNKSKVSLLGYSVHQERIRDEIVSKIPHIDIGDIYSSFSYKSLIRDIKLDSILNNINIKHHWVILDTSRITIDPGELSRAKSISNMVRNFSDSLHKTDIKLLITSHTYSPDAGNYTFNGGSSMMYVSDLVFRILEDRISCSKNRFTESKDYSLDELKDYNYICTCQN